MKHLRFTLIALTVCAALLLAAVIPAAASPPLPFNGNWKGIDVDGSNLTLWIVGESRSGGRVFDIRGNDDSCHACGGGPAEMRAIGILEGDGVLSASLIWWTVPTGDPAYYFLPATFTYDPLTDSVTDSWGVVYRRTP